MKKVLFHSLTIPPDNISTGKLVAEIASKFFQNGVSIKILASSPQYNFDENIYFDQKIFSQKGKYLESTFKNVKIIHIKSAKRSFDNKKRIVQWLNFHLKSVMYLTKNRKNYDSLFIFSYPPTMNLIAIYAKKILKKQIIYSVWELYPEIAEKLNQLNSNFILRVFKSIDNYCLKIVDRVVVNSDELNEYIKLNRNINNNITTIYHFSTNPVVSNPPRNKKIVYTGNLGLPQNVESFIKMFNSSKKEYQLSIYGAGTEYDKIKQYESRDISINEYMSRDKLLEAVKDSTFALVSLAPEITVEGFPGKTFDYLKMNKILIGYSNPNSGLAKFIEKFKVGINIDPSVNNFDEILSFIEDETFMSKVYENISTLNSEHSNLDIISKKYLDLI